MNRFVWIPSGENCGWYTQTRKKMADTSWNVKKKTIDGRHCGTHTKASHHQLNVLISVNARVNIACVVHTTEWCENLLYEILQPYAGWLERDVKSAMEKMRRTMKKIEKAAIYNELHVFYWNISVNLDCIALLDVRAFGSYAVHAFVHTVASVLLAQYYWQSLHDYFFLSFFLSIPKWFISEWRRTNERYGIAIVCNCWPLIYETILFGIQL